MPASIAVTYNPDFARPEMDVKDLPNFKYEQSDVFHFILKDGTYAQGSEDFLTTVNSWIKKIVTDFYGPDVPPFGPDDGVGPLGLGFLTDQVEFFKTAATWTPEGYTGVFTVTHAETVNAIVDMLNTNNIATASVILA
jgi:hypothetical protein